jgi:hypothetical protein
MACFRLELREASCMSVRPGPYEDDEPSGYDYENDHDTSEYCPNVALVSTVKSVIKPLYLLAAPYTFTVMKWLKVKRFKVACGTFQHCSLKRPIVLFPLT